MLKRFWQKFKSLIIGVFSISAVLAAGNLMYTPNPEYITAPENNTYKIGQLNYQHEFKDLDKEKPLQYKLGDKYISFKPVEMRWDKKKIKSLQNVKKEKDEVLYKNIFGNGIDLNLRGGERVWSKIIKINSLDDLGEIPIDAEYLEIEYEIDTNFIIDGWNKNDKFEVIDTTRLGDFSYIKPASAWDSYSEIICEDKEFCENACDPKCRNDNECDVCECDIREVCERYNNKIKVKSYFEKGKYVKQIPVEWLKTAQGSIYTDVDITLGTASEFGAGDIMYTQVVDIDTNKFVVCYMIDTITGGGKCRVGTVSDTTITWGAVVEFENDMYVTGLEELGLAKLDTNEFAISYIDDGGDDDLNSRAATVSTRTISYGTAVEVYNGDWEYITACQIGTDKFVTCGNNVTDGDDGHCIVSDTVGNTINSTGSTAEWAAILSTDITCTQIDTDSFVVSWNPGASGGADSRAVDVSGTTIGTYGTLVTIWDGNTVPDIDSCQLGTDKFVTTYVGPGSDGYSTAYTVSGTTITAGWNREYNTGNTDYVACIEASDSPSDDTHYINMYQASSDPGTPGNTTYDVITWGSPPTIVDGSEEVFSANAVSWNDAANIGAGKLVMCFTDNDLSDNGYCIIGDVTYTGGAADSCTYTGPGDWYIDSSDDCYISSDVYVSGNVYLVDTGAGGLSIIDGATLSCDSLSLAGVPMYLKSGSHLKIY